jgi:hypothetical protein
VLQADFDSAVTVGERLGGYTLRYLPPEHARVFLRDLTLKQSETPVAAEFAHDGEDARSFLSKTLLTRLCFRALL